MSSRRSSIISLLSSRRGPNLARLHRPAPPRHVHGIVGTLIVCWYPATLKYINHHTPNISLASGHLALCAIGRTFYFRNIVFHLSTRPPNLRVASAPTSIFCRTFHNGLATLHNNHNILMSLKCLYLVLYCAVSNSPQLCCVFCYC